MSELTAELIVDQDFPQDVQIAPHGKQVAYILAPMGKKEEHGEQFAAAARGEVGQAT